MVETVRLMPHHDPHWREKVEALKRRHGALLAHDGLLTLDEQRELTALRHAMERALNSRFRTTAEYRDFHVARARQMLEDEGIRMDLPDLADDATIEDIDAALAPVWATVEDITTESP